MNQSLNILQCSSYLHHFQYPIWSCTLFQNGPSFTPRHTNVFFRGHKGSRYYYKPEMNSIDKKILCYRDAGAFQNEAIHCEIGESSLLHVQTLKTFPKEKLNGEVVLVRFDSNILLRSADSNSQPQRSALSTIRYLYGLGAKVLLVSNWGEQKEQTLYARSVADHLSTLLQLKVVPAKVLSGSGSMDMITFDEADVFLLENLTKFKEELSNSSEFAKKLSFGVYLFVNDAFFQSHKILASTVGVACFCHASVAGFQFEEELTNLMDVTETKRRPYIAIIGGGNFFEKSAALQHLASKCDGLVFVGNIAFQLMHALGVSAPTRLVDHRAVGATLEFIRLARKRKIPIILPKDFLCMNDRFSDDQDIFPSGGILTGWTPIDLGPVTLKEISSLLLKCKKILWIGPVEFGVSMQGTFGESELASMLEESIRNGCEVTVVGKSACNAVGSKESHASYKYFPNAATVWGFLKGKTLPGLAALDKAYPFDLDWNAIFSDLTQPLMVDIGSGNGLFLSQMAKRWKHINFLGLDVNKKLVRRCLEDVYLSNLDNLFFLATNATHTFRSIVASYPGETILVSIQCPNPDFNKVNNRWRMVQRTLIEAITDLLAINGKVFLQSDIEEVTTRMKEEFILYGRQMLVIDGSYGENWIKENPFGIKSDWEQHVIDRGDCMYRVMMKKTYGKADAERDDILILSGLDSVIT